MHTFGLINNTCTSLHSIHHITSTIIQLLLFTKLAKTTVARMLQFWA